MRRNVLLTGNDLTLDELYTVVFDNVPVTLSKEARGSVEASCAVIERCVASDAAVYGVNTGFGKMASTRISRDEIRDLQTSLVRSHACGIGAPLSEERAGIGRPEFFQYSNHESLNHPQNSPRAGTGAQQPRTRRRRLVTLAARMRP
jgi:hypothetical protein